MRTMCRPKHQVLVLKCYPATIKTMADPKPNPSELSYLLYYASTRRSKLQKVVEFLDKRTGRDLWRGRMGNVQVTLDICEALIEKCPKDLSLFAPSILSVLNTVLRAGDISLTDYSLKCFDKFCEFHDGANLASDTEYLEAFESVLRAYCSVASIAAGQSMELRWRSIGLHAIRSIASSEALGASDSKRQLQMITPVIVQNLFADSEEKLLMMQERAVAEEEDGPKKLKTTLTRISTTATVDEGAQLSSTSAEVNDKLEEEDIGVIALQSLKKIFETNNTTQIVLATAAVLKCICAKDKVSEKWATTLVEMITRWAPVQYRYQIFTTVQETLVKYSQKESLENQVLLAGLMSHLLSSNLNLIGLSVMDVLLGVIGQIHHLLRLDSSPDSEGSIPPEQPSELEKSLLEKLEKCIGDLATHIYYSDQITDMVHEMVMHIKPRSAASSSTTPAPTLDEKKTSRGSGFYSASNAHKIGLRGLKAVLVTADSASETTGVGRHKVPLRVWEGTHWLLSDEDAEVRRAYVDALLTWLKLEVGNEGNAAEGGKGDRSPRRRMSAPTAWHQLPPSSSSHGRHFLTLIHLTIYDRAIQHASDTGELLTLHLLLTTLITYLGFPAALSGLPMIFALERTVRTAGSDASIVRLSSVVLAYLYSVASTLNLEDIKADILSEIDARKESASWFFPIKFPPVALHKCTTPPAEKNAFISPPTEDFTENIKAPLTQALMDHVVSPSYAAKHVGREAAALQAAHIKEIFSTEWTPELVLSQLESLSRPGSTTESKFANGTVRSQAITTGHPRTSSVVQAAPQINTDGLERFRQIADSPTGNSTSSHNSTVRVSELKRVLSGDARPHTASAASPSSSASEMSIGSRLEGASIWEESPSHSQRHTPSPSGSQRKLASRPPTTAPDFSSGARGTIPPVPPLPQLDLPGSFPASNPDLHTRPKTASESRSQGFNSLALNGGAHVSPPRGSARSLYSGDRTAERGRLDARQLLVDIDVNRARGKSVSVGSRRPATRGGLRPPVL